MKLKVLKNHHWPPDWDFVANDTKNLAQKGSRVRLPDQGWQRKLMASTEPVSKGRSPHYAPCLLWESPDSKAHSARKGPGLQSQLVSSGLQGTEEPTNSGENIKVIYHPAEQSVWKQGQFRNWSKISTKPLRPQILCIFLLFYSDLAFCPQAFSWVMTKWLPQFQRILSPQSHSKMQMKDRFSMHLFFILEEDLSQNVLVERPQVLNMGFVSMLSS